MTRVLSAPLIWIKTPYPGERNLSIKRITSLLLTVLMPAVEMTLTDVTDEERRRVADVYADGKINVRDVTAIQRMLAEME